MSVFQRVTVLVGVAILLACGAGGAESGERREKAARALVGIQKEMIAGLVGDVRIPRPTSDFFNGLVRRNKAEIKRLIDENPSMVWESLDLVLEALPALKGVGKNGGVLRLNSRLYGKTENLFSRYEALASPKLSADMGKARRYIESRIKENENGRMVVDLN